MEQRKEKRTWLAVLLAMLVTGLGHLYLRRWARAAGWVLLAFGASMFVPTEALEAVWNGSSLAVEQLAPVLVVGVASIVDAYLVARSHNARYHAQQAALAGATADVDAVAQCPACGRDVDPDLDFCHWCTTELQSSADEPTE